MCKIAICDRRCKSCCYNNYASGVLYGSCDYFLMEKKMRPCPAGEACICFSQDPDKPEPKLSSKRGVKKTSVRLTEQPETSEKIQRMYDLGYFDKEIAEEIGVNVRQVFDWRKQRDLPSQRKRLGYIGARERRTA